jgi:hypothetical protein
VPPKIGSAEWAKAEEDKMWQNEIEADDDKYDGEGW